MGLIPGTFPGKVIPVINEETGEAISCKLDKSSGGTPQIEVMVEVTDGPRIGDQGKWIGYFKGGATPITLKNLRALGFVGDDILEFPSQDPVRPFNFTVEDQEYKGKTYTKVARIGGDKPVLTAAEAKTLARELAPKLAAIVDNDAPMGSDEPPF